VRVATHVESATDYAVKIMTLPREGKPAVGDAATREEILNEVAILAKVVHPNCLRFKARVQTVVGRVVKDSAKQGGLVLEPGVCQCVTVQCRSHATCASARCVVCAGVVC
jgi:hypothetical protein